MIKNIRFISKTFTRSIEKNTIYNNLNWEQGILNVNDIINGGNDRNVNVEYLLYLDLIYLRAIERLRKSEFEELFGFGCDDFKKNRII